MKLRERFRWDAAPEFKIVNTGKNTVTIEGIAVKAGQISRNKREYVGEELNAAARTFVGVPITINHAPYSKSHPMYDGRKVVGNVRWMDYEQDGRMRYIADVKKQPYVDLLREGSVKVKGVSIEADYLANQCGHCGKDFYDTDSFEKHMVGEHFIKNFNYQPRGMIGRALSLVLSPEEPGVVGNPIKIRESFGGFSQLLETVIKKKKEKESMTHKSGKAVISPIKNITPFRAKEQDVEQDAAAVDPQSDQNPPTHPVMPEAGGPNDPEEDLGEEQPTAPVTESPQPPIKVMEELECAPGFHAEGDECVADKEEEPTTEETVEENPDSQAPAPNPVPTGHVANDPEEDLGEEEPEAVVATLPAPPEVKVTETKLPGLLRLGEPFADYTDFADCVSKNSDKEDPEAYCSGVKQSTEETTLQETLQPHASYSRDMKLASAINGLNKAIASHTLTDPAKFKQIIEYVNKSTKAIEEAHNTNWKTTHKALVALTKQQSKHFKAVESTVADLHNKSYGMIQANQKANIIKAGNVEAGVTKKAEGLATEIAKIKRSTNTTLAQLKESMDKVEPSVLGKVQEYMKSLDVISADIAELKKVKETFEKILAKADENAEATNSHNKDLKEQLESKETETANYVKEFTKRLENVEDKVKPQFRAHAQRVTETSPTTDTPYVKDPTRKK
jgi:hypothetical protein